MQKCLLRVTCYQRFLLRSSQSQIQKYFPVTRLCVYQPCRGFHVETRLESTQQNQTKAEVGQNRTNGDSQKNDKKKHTYFKSEGQRPYRIKLPPREESSHSKIEDSSQQNNVTSAPLTALYKSDGLNSVDYSLIYNNVKQTESYSRTRFAVMHVVARLCVCWMIGNMVFAYMVNFDVIPTYLQVEILVFFALYVFGFWRFYKLRLGYRETVLRLYKENYGFKKKYVMVKPYKFTSTEQRVFTESDLKRLDPKWYPGRFQLNRRKYHLQPDNFMKGHAPLLWEILGHKTQQKKK